MKRASLLIEIGVEELPAIPLLKILNDIEKSWINILKEYRLKSDFKFDYTPRRLTIKSNNFPLKQEDRVVEFFGPPLNIAYKDNKPTKAALGFAKKCGVDIKKISTIKKGDSEVLYYKKDEKGLKAKNLLEEMIYKWLKSMNFKKMMRWGEVKDEFIRPIRWIVTLLDNKIIKINLFNIESNNISYVHRMNQKPKREVDFNNYEEILKDGNIIFESKKREEIILNQIKNIEQKYNVKVEIDKDLLNEIVAITEYPTALIGSFDKKFLELPKEVIITSMKEHQRYFAVFKDKKLSNYFIVVSNAVALDFSKIVAGNKKVLRARLEDALFFYKNDLKKGLSTKGLEQVQFIDGLGSLKDKIKREEKIIEALYSLYKDKFENSKDIKVLLKRAINLAKADLLTEMVYEFTELQGLMGYYYAKALNEDELVYNAIKEQYLPTGDKSKLPSSLFSTLVAMAIKLDTLFGLFSVGKIPTGSKDPFALRRVVNGIIRMVIENDIDFDIKKIINILKPLYKEFDQNQLKDFIFERIYKFANVNPSIVAAVLSSNDSNINTIFKKIKALDEILKEKNSKELFSTFKRVANISKDIDLANKLTINKELFEKKEEKELYENFLKVKEQSFNSYKEKLEALFSLKDSLDRFFDNVLVNVDNKDLRKNRLHLIASIYKEFKDIAEIKEITIN